MKSDPKEKHPPRPARVNSGFKFQAARRSDPGRQEESPPPHARRRKRARYFPTANPITARGARFFPGRERKKSVLFATHCRYFPFFQPKKKEPQGRQCAATCRKSPHKKYCDKNDTLKRWPADFENRGGGGGQETRHDRAGGRRSRLKMLTWKSKGRAQKARQRGRTSARRAAMGILPGAHPLPIRSESGQGLFSYRHRKCFSDKPDI